MPGVHSFDIVSRSIGTFAIASDLNVDLAYGVIAPQVGHSTLEVRYGRAT
jgi:hypothetical protein